MSKRRIILLLDGTWNDAEFGRSDTNITRLRGIIGRSLDHDLVPQSADGNGQHPDPDQKLVSGQSQNGMEHLVFYQRGVGTGGSLLNPIVGGAFGGGLALNVRRAYKFLAFYYKPGDEIFIFGFSRGAYTARSLVGYIAAAGLLTCENCTPELEGLASEFFRTPPDDRLPGVWTRLTEYVHPREALRIKCLGVFDTVGALGIPLPLFRRANRERYQFHNVDLSSITEVNLQALAVDEQREPFQAAAWRKPRFKDYASCTEQVWFPGVHADIGGGYIDEENGAATEKRLDDLTLDWMIRRLRVHFPDFPVRSWSQETGPEWASAPQHNSRVRFYCLRPATVRSIANSKVALSGFRSLAGFDRHADPIGEMLHASVLERLGTTPRGSGAPYAPHNVRAVLEDIKGTYSGHPGSKPIRDIRIVDWNGEPLRPDNREHNERAFALVDAAVRRLELCSSREEAGLSVRRRLRKLVDRAFAVLRAGGRGRQWRPRVRRASR
jgi:type VI secretion system (T6SS) phospholipase Tle1-like effector